MSLPSLNRKDGPRDLSFIMLLDMRVWRIVYPSECTIKPILKNKHVGIEKIGIFANPNGPKHCSEDRGSEHYSSLIISVYCSESGLTITISAS